MSDTRHRASVIHAAAMPPFRRSLRLKFAVVAVVGFVLIALSGAVYLHAAHAARDAVDMVRETHRLTASYTRLYYQSAALEQANWRVATGVGPEAERDRAEALSRFRISLAETAVLAKAAGGRRAAANAVIQTSAENSLVVFHDYPRFFADLPRLQSERGPVGMAHAADAFFAPQERFKKLIETEIITGDQAIQAAAARASTLARAASTTAAVSVVVGFVLALRIFTLTFWRLRRGLERLERGARDVGAGDLSRRICLGGDDELARLSDAFDSMTRELAEKQAALIRAKTGLESAVANRTAELEAANAALAAEDERRRRFLADVGHELRTPLTIIRGEAQVALRAVERGEVDAATAFGRILEQTQGMGRLVDDLFLIARAEAGGLPLRRERVDLQELVQRVAADFDALAGEKSASIGVAPGLAAEVDADPDRLRQIVTALVDNALRHTWPGVAITLRAGADEAEAWIAVDDDGPGVPAGLEGDLFARFRRGETRGDGSGLGLSVVRALIEAQGGTASLENRPDGGARALIRLPRRAKAHPADANTNASEAA